MKVEKIKELLQERLEQIPLLKEQGRDSKTFRQWQEGTRKILEHFDKKCSTNFADSFSAYDGIKTSYSTDELSDALLGGDHLLKASQQEKFLRDLDEAANLLQTVINIDEELYKKPYNFWEVTHPIWWIYQLCRRVFRRVDSLKQKNNTKLNSKRQDDYNNFQSRLSIPLMIIPKLFISRNT